MAVTKIPRWLIGVGVTAVTATPITVASDGTITEVTGSAATLFGHMDELGITQRNEVENISPMNVRTKNHVIVESETTVSLSEILKSNGTNLLAILGNSYDYFKLAITRGGQSFTYYALVGEYEESLQKGKSVGTLRTEMITVTDNSGVMQANPVYA